MAISNPRIMMGLMAKKANFVKKLTGGSGIASKTGSKVNKKLIRDLLNRVPQAASTSLVNKNNAKQKTK